MRSSDYLLTVERITASIAYNPETGEMRWRERAVLTRGDAVFNGKFAGKIAGTVREDGYRYVCFSFGRGKNVVMSAQRVAMTIITRRLLDSDEIVDHENGVRLDNRKSNLRIADATGNSANASIPTTNVSGFKGAHLTSKRGSKKWLANISVGNKSQHIGYFHTAEEAARAYDIAAIAHYGEFAKTNASLGLLQ